MTADEVARLIEGAAAKHGVPTDALMAIANLESSGRVNAQNPRSSASGLFQFVDSTAREYGLTGDRRNDPAAQADAAARMMKTNANSLGRSLGREPNAGELYLAHQQGLTGARALLTNPNRPAIDVLTDVYGSREKAAQAVRLNGGQANQSAGQFAGQWVNKANQRAGLIPPGSIPNVVASQLDTQRPDIIGTAQRPTSAASLQFPTRSSTPRISPQMDGVFAYTPPGLQPAQITPGMGSLTPDFFKRDVALPQARPERQPVQTASVTMPTPLPNFAPSTTPARLPPLAPPNPIRSDPVGLGPTSLASVQDMYGRPPLTRQDPVGMGPTSLASVQDMYGRPSGVGQPPTTRSVASVPVPSAQPGPMNSIGAMPSFAAFQSDFGARAPAVPQMAVPGPSAMPKTEDRLAAGIYPMAPIGAPQFGVASALDVVPNMQGFPPLPQRRPIRPTMPTPVAQRPQPMPIFARPAFGMPTPMAQRPAPAPTMRVTVQGAGSYNAAPSRAPSPSREEILAAIRARSRGPAAFGGGGTIDGAVQPSGTLSGRR